MRESEGGRIDQNATSSRQLQRAGGDRDGSGFALWHRTRTVLVNVLLAAAVVGAVVGAGEAYLRAVWPFPQTVKHWQTVPKVGLRLRPGSEVRATNRFDFWTVSRANSLGFLDREPISPARAAGTCHVAVVGDSFVEANQVPIADKLQVRLERMAAQQVPGLDVTTSAYGIDGTGQVAQLLWWDEWIRHMSPKLVVLVFVDNDFWNNSKLTNHVFVRQRADGGDLDVAVEDPFPRSPPAPARTFRMSEVEVVLSTMLPEYTSHWFLSRWRNTMADRGEGIIAEHYWTSTEFAFDRWIEQVAGTGARLIVLSSHTVGRSHEYRTALKRLAAPRGVPVVDQFDYIVQAGGDPEDAHFANDDHWAPQGHQWAAEALLEWLAANPQTCG